ncbi:hypothetical protein ISF_08500 [Cordyceps fumosorosea ARSEF 2679]|uniref:Atos-like conserved domain-containing protein n=1 Tax=Cordyceps fumosorosea (strain ARSEF 2679) TaxID=1081104 RepID=A0A162MBY5_CORFA|nr:hypothetical protein ISF_08500 [Cordyceps fumosorosea ARSEF 2679]OAA54020.1 hypothetical protein ISF_08500 [Cordyceps fumosorosea ARSEF 2679]
MPIFQEDIDHSRPLLNPNRPSRLVDDDDDSLLRLRRLSEVSLPVELCEGPIPDTPEQRPETPDNQNESHMLDRSVLIERLKRGESPSWIPSRHLDARIQHANSSPAAPTSPQSPNLLPSPQITPSKDRSALPIHSPLHDGLSIERPRSALHSGDFTHDDSSSSSSSAREEHRHQPGNRRRQERASVDMAWMATSPPRPFVPFDFNGPFAEPATSFKSTLSSSLSSSFAYQLPTSPLAQSVTNEDQDGFAPPFREGGLLSDKMDMSRGSYDETLPFSSPLRSRAHARAASFRREATLPYQAHQPRRSSGSGMHFLHPGASPQRPIARSRRPSLGSESSPSLHASMVGSYEESILQGRMSTTPSKPFDFMAQIGVLGKGKCKSRLRCPPHVTLPFPAVFYSYGSTSAARSQSNDGPSPYVGQIDLENGLPNPDAEDQKRRAMRHQAQSTDIDIDMLLDGPLPAADDGPRPGPLKAPPGGSYRIPEKGQIQIVVKNQNKTAVKLFLVPYDLTGMPPGTKTFIRQRSYSHGPIIDNLPSLSTQASTSPADRPTLRYLVHLHVCSPSRGRFYLYKSIRIVFANRVPEGKEKLRNETTLPEPRFTPYRPVLQMPYGSSSSLYGRSGAALAAEKALRRRSLGVPPSSNAHRSSFSAAALATLNQQQQRRLSGSHGGGAGGAGNTRPIEPVPFCFPARRSASDAVHDDLDGPPRSPPSRPSTKDSSVAWGYERLTRGDAGYGGGNFFDDPANGPLLGGGSSGGGGPAAEGLLSQRLRSLGVQQAARSPPAS